MAYERPADSLPNPVPRADWLARRVETAIDPERAIVDPHHHLWDVLHPRYLGDDLRADILASGHRIVATVFIEAGAMYRKDGPVEMRPVGEVEFVNGVAAMSASGHYGPAMLCAGIVGHANLALGAAVELVLDALERAGGGRFRGIRQNSSHDKEVRMPAPPGLLREPAFQEGFARLQARGLTFDAWMYHPQLPDLVALMERFPDARVVLNHIGGRIGIGSYAAQRTSVAEIWQDALAQLARFPNMHIKLGGLGMALAGYDFHNGVEPPSSDDLATAWGPALRTCMDLFGSGRCMFESNFPVDKAGCSYGVLWNAFKKIANTNSEADKDALFRGTASRFYRL